MRCRKNWSGLLQNAAIARDPSLSGIWLRDGLNYELMTPRA